MTWEKLVEMESGADEASPYEKLRTDPALFVPNVLFAERFKIANALITRIAKRNWLRKILIDLGTKKGDVYDQVNKARYVIDDQIDALSEKNKALDQYFYYKTAEMRVQP